MRRVINSTYISLDGVTEMLERWHFEFMDDEANQVNDEYLQASDAALMGRRTYDGFAPVWPTVSGPVADRLNAITKYVVSSTLQSADWNNTTIIPPDDLVDTVSTLKQGDGGDIIMYGFGPVARTLIQHGLLDEVRLWVHPVFVGSTEDDHLLGSTGFAASARLVDVKTLSSGLAILSYAPCAVAS